MSGYFFLFAACVSADAATDFAGAHVLELLSCFDALLATFGDVVSLTGFFAAIAIPFGEWVSFDHRPEIPAVYTGRPAQ